MSWDSFADDATPAGPAHYGCKLCRLLEDVDPLDRKKIQAVLDDPGASHRGITRALKNRGIAMSTEKVSHHRRGDCK